jgi:nicotinate phosphoribosyltransferase
VSRDRLDPALFEIPVDRLRSGWYTDAYFNHSKDLLEHAARRPQVTMQVFQRHEAVLCGIDEAIAVLRLGAGRGGDGDWIEGWDELEVFALHEGDRIEPYETVMTISGDYSLFAHLETVYLGCLARRTRIATNVRHVVEAAAGKEVLFFPARHDHFSLQPGDGWAAHVGGPAGVSTDGQGAWWGGTGLGTVPHALIAAYGGDTVAAAKAFADRFADEMRITVLVDFDNDSVRTALDVAEALGERLWGVRLDTSGTLVDRSLWREMGYFDPTGVNIELARRVRAALDEGAQGHVRIVVSGGFDAQRIAVFEQSGAPVDVYGVGSSLIRGENDFTADVVLLEGEPKAKVGRSYRPNPRLERVS